jgi:hypothetical protein
MSALDLAAVSRDAVLQAALKLQLQLLKTQRQPTDCSNCAEHFEQLWDRCVHGSAHSSTRVDWLGILLCRHVAHTMARAAASLSMCWWYCQCLIAWIQATAGAHGQAAPKPGGPADTGLVVPCCTELRTNDHQPVIIIMRFS